MSALIRTTTAHHANEHHPMPVGSHSHLHRHDPGRHQPRECAGHASRPPPLTSVRQLRLSFVLLPKRLRARACSTWRTNAWPSISSAAAILRMTKSVGWLSPRSILPQ